MSITITTGGITMTGGGVSFTAPPPAQATYGWYGAGYSAATAPIAGANYYSGVQRIDYSSDLTTASTRGPLSIALYLGAATGNATDGWFGGGRVPGNPYSSSVSRMTYATDTATGSTRGPLSAGRYSLGATGTSTAGWFAAGTIGYGITLIDRITYATDTATASVRGSLLTSSPSTITGKQGVVGITDKTTYGWFAGGGPADSTTVNRITYATDTANAPMRGPLINGCYNGGSSCTSDYGWFAFNDTGAGSTLVQRITYATDTALSSIRGPLSYQASYGGGNGNNDYGWFGGGYTPGILFSQVSRITYATDTATASTRGSLATYLGFTSGTQNTFYS